MMLTKENHWNGIFHLGNQRLHLVIAFMFAAAKREILFHFYSPNPSSLSFQDKVDDPYIQR